MAQSPETQGRVLTWKAIRAYADVILRLESIKDNDDGRAGKQWDRGDNKTCELSEEEVTSGSQTLAKYVLTIRNPYGHPLTIAFCPETTVVEVDRIQVNPKDFSAYKPTIMSNLLTSDAVPPSDDVREAERMPSVDTSDFDAIVSGLQIDIDKDSSAPS